MFFHLKYLIFVLCAAWCSLRVSISFASDPETKEAFFESRIRPILSEKCERCHSTAKGTTHGGLALDSYEGWKQGSDSGDVILPSEPDASLLLKAIEYSDESIQMPPPDEGGKLSDREISFIRQWIEEGAFDPRVEAAKRGGLTEEEIHHWWSFHELASTNRPVSKHQCESRFHASH